MKKLTWLEFIEQPILPIKRSGGRKVEHADELVTLVKQFSNIIGMLIVNDDIDFGGCSENYVREKIDLLKRDLDWLSNRIKEVSKKRN